jgi:hypothetical protein
MDTLDRKKMILKILVTSRDFFDIEPLIDNNRSNFFILKSKSHSEGC